MTETVVSYHRDGFRVGRPAINVKSYGWIDPDIEARAAAVIDDEGRMEAICEGIRDNIAESWWEDAEHEAADLGLGPIEQEGRSGGWLVLTDGRDPETLHCVNHEYEPSETCAACVAMRRAWLARYRKLSEWCRVSVADVPRAMAADLLRFALDEAGERTITLRSWLAWGKEYAL